MNNTKTIEKIIKSKEAPKNTNVIWLDLNETEDINNPSLKVFNDGKWVHITADMQELINTLDIVLQDKADLVGGKVPASQLPSYVDDVIEFYEFYDNNSGALASNYGEIYFMNKSIPGKEQLLNKFVICVKNTVPPVPFTYEFAFEPERGKLYLSKYTNKLYRWTGSVLLDITQKGLQLGTTSTKAFPANLGYKHETGRFGSNSNIQISNGKGSSVRIGPMTEESVYIAGNVEIGQQMNSAMSFPVKIGGNVNVYACTIGTKTTPEGVIEIGTDCTNFNYTLQIKGNTKIGSSVNIADGVSLSSNIVIKGNKINIGTTNAYIRIGDYANSHANIIVQGNVNIGTMGTGKVEILGSIYIGNTSYPVYVGNINKGSYDKKATTIAKGVYIGSGTFIGSNVEIGRSDDTNYYDQSLIKIGTVPNSSININGLNVSIGSDQNSKILIGINLSSNPVTELSSGEVYIGERVMILNDFDTRNIVLGTDSKSKIYINNTAGELSFGTNGNNYAVTFGSNSITFTNKLTNLSTSLTLA